MRTEPFPLSVRANMYPYSLVSKRFPVLSYLDVVVLVVGRLLAADRDRVNYERRRVPKKPLVLPDVRPVIPVRLARDGRRRANERGAQTRTALSLLGMFVGLTILGMYFTSRYTDAGWSPA